MRSNARIARKNCRITFQKNEVVIDDYQNHINAWVDYFSCFAYVRTYTNTETGDVVINEERNITFEIRYCPELAVINSVDYRIMFNGDTYNIVSVDMMNYQNKGLKFRCQLYHDR